MRTVLKSAMGPTEIMAQSIAESYWAKGGTIRRTSFTWEDLEEPYRESYRRWADAVSTALAQAGYVIVKQELT